LKRTGGLFTSWQAQKSVNRKTWPLLADWDKQAASANPAGQGAIPRRLAWVGRPAGPALQVIASWGREGGYGSHRGPFLPSLTAVGDLVGWGPTDGSSIGLVALGACPPGAPPPGPEAREPVAARGVRRAVNPSRCADRQDIVNIGFGFVMLVW